MHMHAEVGIYKQQAFLLMLLWKAVITVKESL